MKPIGGLTLAVALAASGCDSPSDRIFEPDSIPPVEIQPGLYRLTWNDGPDVVRGFTPDGTRILYNSTAVVVGSPFPQVRMLSVSVEGGAAREEAGLYRTALRQPVGNLTHHEGRRLLSIWLPGVPGSHSCSTCPLPPTAIGIRNLLLPADDSEPLSALPDFERSFRTWNSDAGMGRHVIRVTPAETQVRTFGVDPFRAALVPGTLVALFSDGETVWRYDASTTGGAPDSLLQGAFVAISADGTRLAVSSPVGLDSTSGQCSFGLDCQQMTTTMTITDWNTTIYDYQTLSVVAGPFAGLEPVFHPDGTQLLLRRFGGLFWIDIATGQEVFIERTEGAFGPALTPDGSGVAFSARLFGNADVFFMP